jgi:hypothetical protein
MCDCNEGALLKEFDDERSYSWSELADMTEVCASCGSDKSECCDANIILTDICSKCKEHCDKGERKCQKMTSQIIISSVVIAV